MFVSIFDSSWKGPDLFIEDSAYIVAIAMDVCFFMYIESRSTREFLI